MILDTPIKATMRLEKVVMIPRDDMPLNEAVQKLEALGHTVLDVDVATREITVQHKEHYFVSKDCKRGPATNR